MLDIPSPIAPRLAAGCVFYETWDILPITISNLIAHGVTEFYVMDHASTRDRGAELVATFSQVARIRWCRKLSPPFQQGRMMSALARAAQDDGFDVFIPFDSDEFWGTVSGSFDLREPISHWWSNGQGSSLRVREVDFAQAQAVDHFSIASLSSARYRTISPSEDAGVARSLIEEGAPYFFRAPSSKVVVRLTTTHGPCPNIEIAEGSHSAFPIDQPHDESDILLIRHLPFRDRKSIHDRAEQGRRRRAAGFSQDIGWQNQLISDLRQGEIDRFWQANSWVDSPDGPQLTGSKGIAVQLIEDTALSEIAEHCFQLGLPTVLLDGTSESQCPETNELTSHVMSLLLDTPNQVAGVLAQRDAAEDLRDDVIARLVIAENERDTAIAERDKAMKQRDLILNSRIWRSTRWYRQLSWVRRLRNALLLKQSKT